jgi:chemotaxis protein methyltransferase CheR
MTPREQDQVAAVCASRAGLNIDTERSYLMESRLAAVARREGFASIPDLVRALRDRGEGPLVWAVVEALTPAASGFFQDPKMFARLADDLQARTRGGGSARVWSAACGAGQEIYSLAMLADERRIEGVELFASDLAERRLEKARNGLYTAIEAQQGLSARRLVRHFVNADEDFQVIPRLRARVRWRRMNLIEAPAGIGAFDVILCRGVLHAFLEPARDRALANLAQALRPGGHLVLGANDPAPLGFVGVEGRPGVFAVQALAAAA